LALASFVSGLFVGAGGAGVIVVAANAYPTAIRSTGLGWAMGMARLGQVVGPFIGGLMLAAGWGADRIFMSVAVPALLAALAIALLGTFAQSMTADLVKRKGAALAH
jgi:AAHS family 4-hydroxybenzoate transporter-like MFS transporter